MNGFDHMNNPNKKKGPTVDETVSRMTFIKTRIHEDLQAVKDLKTNFPIDRGCWDSLSTIIHLFEVGIVELDISISGYKRIHGRE